MFICTKCGLLKIGIFKPFNFQIGELIDLLITMVRFKIAMVGAPAISKFLVELQVYKSTGDVKGARKMYEGYSEVSREGKKPWLLWGDIVIARKKLRTILVLGNTVLENKTMNLVQYDQVGLL